MREAREIGNVQFDRNVLERLEQAAAPVVAFDRYVREAGADSVKLAPVPMSEVD